MAILSVIRFRSPEIDRLHADSLHRESSLRTAECSCRLSMLNPFRRMMMDARAGATLFRKLKFCIEHRNGPVYFRIGENSDQSQNDIEGGKLYDVLSQGPVTYVSSFICDSCFAKNIERHHMLKNAILSRPEKLLPYSGGMAFNTVDHFEHGLFIKLLNDVTPISFLDELRKMQMLGDSVSFTAYITDGKATANIYDKDSLKSLPITPIPSPTVHPAFIYPGMNAVYQDIERVYHILNQFAKLQEVKELQSICNEYIQRTEHWKSLLPLKAKNPVIMIEGLDATGKTTLAKNLIRKLNGPVLKSPPECVIHLRSKFDSHPELLRRAFYALGNYAFSAMICDASNDDVVIVDRFWNSTAAYAIAKEVSVGGADCLPPAGHDIYRWPHDLLRPDAVVLLTVNDEVRRQRLKDRGSVKTDEEIRLEQSSHFRQRLQGAYMRMLDSDGPAMLHVDASGTEEEVLNQTFELLRSKGLI